MTDEQKLEKLKVLVEQQLKDMIATLNYMYTAFNESGELSDINMYIEDLAATHHRLIQMSSMYGYFEMLNAGNDPLEHM